MLLVVGWVLTWRPALDPDLWWHLELGDLIRATGSIPTVEAWSWWSAGRPILAHSWAWDVLVATAHGAAGPFGVSILGAMVSGLVVGLLWWLLRLTASTVSAALRASLVIAAVLTALVSWSPRAQLLDLVAVLAIVVVLERWLRTGRATGLVALPVIALAWANLHGSAAPAGLLATLGLASVGLLAGEQTGRWPRRSRTPVVVAGVAALAALLANPAGPGLLIYPFDAMTASAFVREIAEWAPPDLGAPGFLPFRLALAAAVVALAIPVRRPSDPMVVLLAAGWTVLALGSARFVLVAGPLLVVAAGPLLTSVLPVRRTVFPATVLAPRGRSMIGVLSALAIAAILLAGSTLIVPATQERLVAATFPTGSAARLAAGDCDGRLLNAYDWGGYLLRHTERQIGAYGNSPGDVVRTQADLEALRIDPRPWLDEQDVGVVMVRAGGPLARWIRTAPEWQVALDDGQALIAVRAGEPCQIR